MAKVVRWADDSCIIIKREVVLDSMTNILLMIQCMKTKFLDTTTE